jgi:hypothetical protein
MGDEDADVAISKVLPAAAATADMPWPCMPWLGSLWLLSGAAALPPPAPPARPEGLELQLLRLAPRLLPALSIFPLKPCMACPHRPPFHLLLFLCASQAIEAIRRAEAEPERASAGGVGGEMRQPAWLAERAERDRWDCETILTLTSNLDNHPASIVDDGGRPPRARRPRRVSPAPHRLCFLSGNGPPSGPVGRPSPGAAAAAATPPAGPAMRPRSLAGLPWLAGAGVL